MYLVNPVMLPYITPYKTLLLENREHRRLQGLGIQRLEEDLLPHTTCAFDEEAANPQIVSRASSRVAVKEFTVSY